MYSFNTMKQSEFAYISININQKSGLKYTKLYNIQIYLKGMLFIMQCMLKPQQHYLIKENISNKVRCSLIKQ